MGSFRICFMAGNFPAPYYEQLCLLRFSIGVKGREETAVELKTLIEEKRES
jgi:hypothetical protein